VSCLLRTYAVCLCSFAFDPCREHSVCSPIKKKSSKIPSLDDCLDDLNDILTDARERKSRRITEANEMAKVN